MMFSPDWFADVVVPLPLPQRFTYAIPEPLLPTCLPGARVAVEFGPRRLHTAIVWKVHQQRPADIALKPILDVLDTRPLLDEQDLRFWDWMADYYLCATGEVLKAALPAGLQLESQTQLAFNPDYEPQDALSPLAAHILRQAQELGRTTVADLLRANKSRGSLAALKTLVASEALVLEESLTQRYKPKLERMVRRPDRYQEEAPINQALRELARSPKQMKILLALLQLDGHYDPQGLPAEVSLKRLLEKAEAATPQVNALVEKGMLEIYTRQVDRTSPSATATLAPPKLLNPAQQEALRGIRESWSQKNIVLLHGVTSSGKTELYIHLIQEQIDRGRQVLYLLPEIALTTQIVERLRAHFGQQVGVYHSKFNDAERVELWLRMAEPERAYSVVLGARSSLFLPMPRLGLVIVDEEHESAFKQHDPAPRYHARDAAMVLASLRGAKVLLGSATPSIESYHNALAGKFGLVELSQRHSQANMPEVFVADVRKSRLKKQMVSLFHPLLAENIREALRDGQQVILFQNRRGFAPFVECADCGHVPQCPHCDVSLTYHRENDRLICHYCGQYRPSDPACPECHSPKVKTRGMGTQQVVEELGLVFPEARVGRLDLDSTRGKRSFEQIIGDFEAHRLDILVGTQMVTKGLDFRRVSVVGIIDADNLLFFPDFRAHERGYQLMAQVSGRTGRADKQGLVVLQTRHPEHPVVEQVAGNRYREMFEQQNLEREAFAYPPHWRLVRLSVKSKSPELARDAAVFLAERLRERFGQARVLGPEAPLVARVQDWSLQQILVKFERQKSERKAKDLIRQAMALLDSSELPKSFMVLADVDPQ